MIRYQVTLSYDGSNYKGWQVQPGKKSLQATIETAFSTLYKTKIEVVASGRTDTGVHALGQVFHYDVFQEIPEKRIVKGINSLLPKDIRILKLEKVDSEFHARYLAQSKIYEYRVNLGCYDLFQRNYCLQFNQRVDVSLIKAVLKVFVGTHDFTSFNTTTLKENHNQVRTIEKFSVKEVDDLLIFTIQGSGFLRYMIRMLIGTTLEVGRGKLSIDEVKIMLEKQEKGVCRYKAGAEGLYLKRVIY